MAIINDPDQLDRFQVAVDPLYKTISLRGSGTFRVQASTGSGTAEGDFIDSTENFVTASVAANDILAVVSDEASNGGVIGHYKITAVEGTSGVVLDRAITQTGGSGISYQIYSTGVRDVVPPSLADGVTMQALYSFLKEEWRVNSLSASGEDLIKYTFPMVSITSEQFEIGGVSNSNWEFSNDTGDGPLAAESSRNLIRTGGWASINNSGQIIENYPSVVTLGSLESDSQVYYQLTSATTDPENFVLTGPVNQSIRTLETIGDTSVDGNKVPASGYNGAIEFVSSPASIRAANGTDLYALGFTSGELIQVRQSASNNGFFTIQASGGDLGVSGVFVTEAVTAESDTAGLLSPILDNRDYLVLRVRTKGKTYAQSEIADIGVTQVNTIVNRFPLAEADDPAITLTDGQLGGDGTDATDEVQVVETFNTASDGQIGSTLTDGSFTFTSAGGGFLGGDSAFFANNVLQPGDSIEIENSGFMEVKSVDSDTELTVFFEPTGITGGGAADFQGGGNTVTFTTKTATLDSGSVAGTFAFTAGGGQATLTDAARAFNANGGLGARTISSGDVLQVTTTDGDTDAIGYYLVESLTGSTILNVSARDLVGTTTIAGDTVGYRVLDDGMFLQYKKTDGTAISGIDTFSGATITDASIAGGATGDFQVGGTAVVSGTTNNDGTYIITDVTSTTITVINTDGTSPTFNGADDGTGVLTPSYGHLRDIGGVTYSYNWRLFGNNGSLAQCFQFLQRELRRATDIDGSDTTSRGDITDLLMTFAAPNGTTLNLIIDDVDPAEKNNLTQQDSTANNRNFPFLVTLRIALNSNITNASTNKVVVFFSDNDGTPGNGDEFGTAGATIVQDENSANMVAEDQAVSPKDFVYNYTGEGDIDRAITVVCITDDTGQYVQAESTLTRDNIVNVSLVAGLERNYSNP